MIVFRKLDKVSSSFFVTFFVTKLLHKFQNFRKTITLNNYDRSLNNTRIKFKMEDEQILEILQKIVEKLDNILKIFEKEN